MYKLIVLFFAFFLFSCESKNDIPKGILKPAKMQLVLWDVIRADVFTYEFVKKDSAKIPEVENVKLQQQIFAIHKTTKDEFYKSFSFYKTHPDIMQPLLDSIISKATKDRYAPKQTITKPLKDSLKAE